MVGLAVFPGGVGQSQRGDAHRGQRKGVRGRRGGWGAADLELLLDRDGAPVRHCYGACRVCRCEDSIVLLEVEGGRGVLVARDVVVDAILDNVAHHLGGREGRVDGAVWGWVAP